MATTAASPVPAARFQFRFAGAKGKAAAIAFLRGHAGTPGVVSAISRFSGTKLVWDVSEDFAYFPLLVLMAERRYCSLKRDKMKMSPACVGALVLRVLGSERRLVTNYESCDPPSRMDFAAAIGGVNGGSALAL